MAQRFYFPREQSLTNLGAVGIGWRLFTYETGTVIPKATFSNVALTSANANPASGATTGNQVSDSNGRFGDIFVDNLADYKAILKDDLDNTIWTTDPVDPKSFTLADFDPVPTAYWGVTNGTSTVYTLASEVPIDEYSDTHCFFLDFNVACGASPTLNIDSLGALDLKKYINSGGSKTDLEENDVLPQRYLAINDGVDIVILNPEKPYLDARNISQATENEKGVGKLASQATTNTGTNDTDFITSLKLKNSTSIIKLGSVVASTSGTSIDFTDIPAGIKSITVIFAGLSTSGTSTPIIQLGDSGGVEATGYLGASSGMGVGVTTNNFTTGFALGGDSVAAAVRHGVVNLSLIDGSTWVASGVNARSDSARTDVTAGLKALSATLDRVRITTVGGVDTFDAGSINIQYL